MLVDLLDTDNQTMIDLILKSNLDTGRLDLDSILQLQRVKNSLLFGELWKEIFGVYPCFAISNAFLDNQEETIVEAKSFCAFLVSQISFIGQYLLDEARIRERLAIINSSYDVKQMSILKIANRYGVDTLCEDHSLFSLYSSLTSPKSLQNTKSVMKALAVNSQKHIATLDDLFYVHQQCVSTLNVHNRNPFNGLGRQLTDKIRFRTTFDAFAYCFVEPSVLLSMVGAHAMVCHRLDIEKTSFISSCIPNGKVLTLVELKPKESVGTFLVFYHPLSLNYAPKLFATHFHFDDVRPICASLTRVPRRTLHENKTIKAHSLWVPMPTHDRLLEALSSVFMKSLLSFDIDANTLAYYQFIMRYYDKHRDTLMANFAPSKNARNAVLIIDTRNNILSVMSMLFTFHNLLKNMWALTIVCNESNIPFYDSIFGENSQHIEYATQFELPKSNFSIDAYNRLLKSVTFWKFLKDKYRQVLLIQDDGMLVRKGLENAPFFGQTKYIGAPWCPNRPENMPLRIYTNDRMIGNGGLSLRNTEAMFTICKQVSQKNRELHFNGLEQEPEDVFFARHIDFDASSTFSIAGSFSTEQIMTMDSFGFHKFWMYHKLEDVLEFFNRVLGESHSINSKAFDLEYNEKRER